MLACRVIWSSTHKQPCLLHSTDIWRCLQLWTTQCNLAWRYKSTQSTCCPCYASQVYVAAQMFACYALRTGAYMVITHDRAAAHDLLGRCCNMRTVCMCIAPGQNSTFWMMTVRLLLSTQRPFAWIRLTSRRVYKADVPDVVFLIHIHIAPVGYFQLSC